MPILLADSNALGKPALFDYLSKSTSNRIALAEEVMMELHKREPAYTVKTALETARKFPKQVIVLHGVTSIYGTPINSSASARKLIDKRSTANFPNWYDEVAGSDGVMPKKLAGAHKQALQQLAEIAATVKYVLPIFSNMKKRFSQDEIAQIRHRVPYGPETQKKLLDIMFNVSRSLFVNTEVPESQYPLQNQHAFRYFIFRYAMCMTLLYTRWVNIGNLSSDTAKLTNHVIDMHLAALGTFFSGVLSDDRMLVEVHQEARFLLRATGKAYVG